MSGLFLTPDELAQSAGLQEGLATGLTSLGPSAADFATLREQTLARVAPSAGTPGLIPPTAPAYYNPSSNQMFAGGRAFDTRDVSSALQAAQNLTPSAPPPGAGWQPITGREYGEFVQSLGRPRGAGELLVSGARGVAGGVVSGVGALAEMAGATEVGPAIMRAGETVTGQDEFDRQRSALIQRTNSTFSNILDAAIQGVPSVVASGIAGLAGAAVGGAVGGPAGAAAGGAAAATLARARTIGAIGGAFVTSFPQQVSTMYEAAQNARTPGGQPAYNTNDTSTQLTILGAAFGTSLLDAIAPGRAVGGVSSALARAAEEAGQQAVRGMARARAVGGAAARSSLEEAATEATQTLVERAVFDPEFRRQLSANDWKALAPYVVEKYGEDILISAGAGAILGGGFGGAGRFIETRPRDILTDAGAPPAAPPAAAPPAGGPPAFPGPAPGAPPTPGVPPASGALTSAPGAMDLTRTGYLQAYARRMPDPLGVAGFGGADDTFNRMISGPAPGTEAPLTSYVYPGPVLTEPEPTIQPRTPLNVIPGAPTAAPYTPTLAAPIPSGTTQPITLVAPGADALRAQRGITATAQQRQVEQNIQSRMQANASAPRPDVLYDPADPGTTQRAMQSLGVSIEEVLGLRDPSRAMVGAPVTLRDVNEAAALLGRTRGSGTPAARPTPVVSPNMAQAMQDAGLTIEDVMAARNRLRSGPVTYEDVLIAARRKGVEIPVRLAQSAEPVAPAVPVAEAAPAVEAVVPTPDNIPPALAPLVGPATSLKKGKGRATQVRQVEQGGVSQRAGAGGPVPSKGQDRLKQAKEQGGGGQAGRSNLTRQGRAAAQEVTPAPAAEVAAQRPLEQVAPSATERAAPSVAPRAEADLTANLNAQIDRATTPAARQRLRVSLINRRNDAADAGRSTTELSAAIARLDEMAAEGVTTPAVEGVLGPAEPQSIWASVMDDDGTGYTNMSEDGRKAWDAEVRGNPIRPTRERAQFYQDSFLSEDTQKGLSYVRSLASKLEKASDEQYFRITETLSTLSASDNKLVAAAATRALDEAMGGGITPEMTRRGFLRVAAASVITSIIPSRARALTPITDARLLGLLRNGDLNGALAHIAANSANPAYRSLAATFLRTGVGGFKVRVLPTDSRSLQAMVDRGQIDMRTAVRAQGTYGFVQVERLNDLNVNLVDTKQAETGLSEEVLLHETLHAWVMSRMFLFGMYGGTNNARLLGYTPDPNVKAAYDATRTELQALNTYLNENKASIPQADEFLREGGPLSNADEFLAYGLTDVGFRNFLDSIAWDRRSDRYVPKTEAPTGSKSALTRFFEWLSRLLFGNPTQASALERFTQLSEQLFRTEQAPDFTIAKKFVDQLQKQRGPGRFSLTDWNTVANARNLDGSAVKPMPSGRARMTVQNFLSKLATKPNVTVVANQEELQRTNPALYQQAMAARPQGDFATAAAAGYSFGDGNVVIFTDRIANEQHLRFVLAHETLGHFGMRGIMPGAKFDALMNSIYETDPRARLAVDAAVEVRGLSRAEATEEYLSDYAALLETSVVARVWNAIKGFLDKLGVKSGDAVTRYFLDQTRRYVKQGNQGVTFDAKAVMDRLHAVEYGDSGTGRFSPEATMSANAQVNMGIRNLGMYPQSLDEVFSFMQKAGTNFMNGYNDFKDKFLRLRNFVATENPGFAAANELMVKTNQISMSVKSALDEYLRPLLDASPASQRRVSIALYDARGYKTATTNKRDLGKEPLFSVNEDGEFIPNVAEQERLFKAGLMTLKQIQDGYSYDFPTVGADGKPTTIKKTVAGQKDFTEADYALYVRGRRAVFNTDLRLLQAEQASFLANKRLTNKEIGTLMRSDTMTAADRKFVDSMARRALALYTKNVSTDDAGNTIIDPNSMEEANKFLEAVNAAVIGTGTDRNAAIRPFFESEAAANTFIENLTDFKSRRKDTTEANKFILQNKVKQLILDQHNQDSRITAIKYSMATGYIPVIRRGNYEMRVQAYIGNTPVEVKDVHKELLAYSQFDTETDAMDMAKFMNGEFGNKTFELLVRNDAGEFEARRVTLRAESRRVLQESIADPQINLQDFLRGLDMFGVAVNPTSMEKIITRLTRQGEGARRRLAFSDTPGYDREDGIRAMSQHIEQRASTIAKVSTRQEFNELMNLSLPESRNLWEGDRARVDALKARLDAINADPNAPSGAKQYALQQYTQAQYQYLKTNPEGDVGRSQSMKYYNQMAAARDYLEGSKFVDETDIGSGAVASQVRAYTGMFQLGASVAQGVLNLTSIYSNWLPYMASFNPRNGFGGGFSLGKTMAEYHKAMRQIGARGMTTLEGANRAEFYDAGPKPTDPTLAASWKPGIAQDPALQKKYGLTADEARIMAREIREGRLQAAQSNALVATARGKVTNKYARKFVDYYMAPFNLSEQAARRSAFLAAYRLKYEQATAAGRSQKQAQEEAADFAVKAIDLTLGDYSVMNRPPAFRSGLQSFLYIYKTYPTTTVQLLANLSRPAQLSMLAGLWFLAGAAGLPFAEDLEDLIDTLSQQLGFRQGSIRAEIIRHIESMFPGMSATFLKGVVNQFLPIPADIASRTSMGNIIPGTGAFLSGANTTREILDILGPATGMVLSTAETAKNLVTFPFSTTRSFEDVARDSPVTLLRLLGDSYAYYQSGAVVDRRGYIVSKDMDLGTIFTRLAGFYPTAAANQYDVIRIAQRQTDYQKEAVAAYRQAWLKATMRGDTAGANEVLAEVREWSAATRGTPLDIPPGTFMQGNTRALREAMRPAGERALRAAPRAAQEDIRNLTEALTD